jgi:hypothetical protein
LNMPIGAQNRAAGVSMVGEAVTVSGEWV